MFIYLCIFVLWVSANVGSVSVLGTDRDTYAGLYVYLFGGFGPNVGDWRLPWVFEVVCRTDRNLFIDLIFW